MGQGLYFKALSTDDISMETSLSFDILHVIISFFFVDFCSDARGINNHFPSTLCPRRFSLFLRTWHKKSKVNNNSRFGWHRNKTTSFFLFRAFIDWRSRCRSKERETETAARKMNSTKIHFLSSLSTAVAEEIPKVKLRRIFPFLRLDDEGQAKQSVKSQSLPQLLNSYQGHRQSITGLVFSQDNQVLISSSSDKSVRLWNLSGQVSSVDDKCRSVQWIAVFELTPSAHENSTHLWDGWDD